jgi:hypothetical protein
MSLLPPSILDMRLPTRERGSFHLWLPLFLLWPLIWLLELILLVPAIVVDVLSWLVGRDYHRYTHFLLRCFGLIGETRGMVVRVRGNETDIDMAIW